MWGIHTGFPAFLPLARPALAAGPLRTASLRPSLPNIPANPPLCQARKSLVSPPLQGKTNPRPVLTGIVRRWNLVATNSTPPEEGECLEDPGSDRPELNAGRRRRDRTERYARPASCVTVSWKHADTDVRADPTAVLQARPRWKAARAATRPPERPEMESCTSWRLERPAPEWPA